MNYQDQIKNPNWQKKRLEIMQRDDFTCQSCMDSDSTLNVHHKYYLPNKKIWEYPSESLVTLCEFCHKDLHESQYQLERGFLIFLYNLGFNPSNLDLEIYELDSVNNRVYSNNEQIDRLISVLSKLKR